jgi:hypothetical protein
MTTIAATIKRQAREAGGIRALARKIGTDPGYLCKLRDGTKVPSDNVLAKLGLERVVTYRRIER